MPSHIKNAVRMLQPFHSDNTTVDKARSFWDAFERATMGLNDVLRLSVFRERLKGKPGEEWWMYSHIEDFMTLKTRFHNQFICQTPQQMIERLKNTKRSRGMSAEVWGDLISGLCDAAHCYDPQMRYQYFLAGFRNKEWRSALATTMVNSIPQAVAVLLYKNMHLPVEDDSEFRDELPSSTTNENAMMQKMLELMESNQVLQQQLLNLPRSPRRGTVAATSPAPSVDPNGLLYVPSLPTLPMAPTPRGVRQDPDMRSQEGRVICGRCYILGHSRAVCRRALATCNTCQRQGHIAPECELPRPQQLSNNAFSGPSGYNRACYLCKQTDHVVANCPSRVAFDQMISQRSQGQSQD
ncbi:hypothetical protein PHMEG_00030327 [Phytophthora megakarya]|uniref:CCHC-type domain-containing protein n=1 Tax=Phytophthora megakarya TaxID=4795 RepID=A0A225V053_9STRA|nr:hypothetical protein PHMEG_00030327 [Phytophthora megakarya]